jgi:hypothetical protein
MFRGSSESFRFPSCTLGARSLALGTHLRNYWSGPGSETWPGVSLLASVPIPGRIYFPTRDSFEHFLAALEERLGYPPEISPSLDATGPTIHTPEELFKFTSQKVFSLVVSTGHGRLFIDNSTRKGSSVVQAMTREPEGLDDLRSLVFVAQRYVHQVPAWRRLVRTPAVTPIPDVEQRDNRWKLNVGLWSAAIGGLLGFLGGVVSGSMFPGG